MSVSQVPSPLAHKRLVVILDLIGDDGGLGHLTVLTDPLLLVVVDRDRLCCWASRSASNENPQQS